MLVKCTDPQGVGWLKEIVDARECVAQLGWTMEPHVPVKTVPFVGAEKNGGIHSTVRVPNNQIKE